MRNLNLVQIKEPDLAHLLTQIEAKIADLRIVEEAILLNKEGIVLAASRLTLQHTMLRKMLNELQEHLTRLHEAAERYHGQDGAA